jgi:transcriptional regulator with XRE-family HTH domain
MAELGLSQNDLIEPMGVKTRGAVGHFMTGRREPSMGQLVALANTLRMSIDDLVHGEQRPLPLYERRPFDRALRPSQQIPIRGLTTVSTDGKTARTEDFDEPAGWFDFSSSDPQAFALEIAGGSVLSVLRPGWFLIIEPGAIVVDGDTALILLDQDRDSIQEVLWQREDGLVVASLATGERSKITEPIIDLFRIAAILPPSAPKLPKDTNSIDM